MPREILNILILMMILAPVIVESQSSQLSKKSYTIGVFPTPPLSLINESGNPDGLIVNLIDEIAKQENLEINWIFDDWTDHYNRIQNRRLDVITSVGYTEERAEFLEFSKTSFVTVWGQVFLPNNSSVESILDLNNKTIGILKDGVNGNRFKEQCLEFDVKCDLVEFEDYEDLFQAISNEKVEAGVANNLVGNAFVSKYNVINSSIVFNPFKVFIAIPKDEDPSFLNLFDKYVSNWKQNPTSLYFQTRLRWVKPLNQQRLPQKYLILVGIVGLIALLSIFLAFLFKKQVLKRVSELSGREQQLNQIINLVPHLIYVADTQGNIVLANQHASDFFGMTNNQFEISNVAAIQENNITFQNVLDDSIVLRKSGSKATHREIETKDSDNNRKVMYLSKMPFVGRENNEPAVVTVAVDITESREFEKRIKYVALHDSLTGLPNRTLLFTKFHEAIAHAKKTNTCLGLMSLDIDYFKYINDSLGHQVGDLLIQKVSLRLKEILYSGEIISRLGGDEFVVLIQDLSNNVIQAESEIIRIGESIFESLSKPFIIEKDTFHITVSIGIVLYPRDGENKDLLLQRADTALYKAKNLGRNQIHLFTPELEASAKNRHALENDLRVALKNNEFYLEYQSVFDDKNWRGCEALIRWNHPTKGKLYPNSFIEIAEQKNIIIDIGNWVLEQALIQINTWFDEGKRDFFISVNVSINQIKSDNFFKQFKKLINTYNTPSSYLEIEVTETLLMKEVQRSIHVLKKLRKLGVKISIDDFGTGYSSFKYLMQLPLDKLKIDRFFVKGLPSDNNYMTIVKTILQMAKELKMEVVAEGVETNEQLELLKENNCKYFQGYYLHKPSNIKDLESL